MEIVTEEKIERFKLSDFLIKDISRKTSEKQFKNFLKDIDFRTSGSKTHKMVNMQSSLNKLDIQSYDEKIGEIEEFFSSQIKYNSNRIVISYPIEVSTDAPIYCKKNLESHTEQNEEEFIFSKILDEEFTIGKNFKKLGQSVQYDLTDLVLKIEMVYVRHVNRSKESENIKTEFVYIEIDTCDEEVRIHIENNQTNYFTDLQGKPDALYGLFSSVLRRDLAIHPLIEPENHTLFLLYKELTSYAEQSYLDKITPFVDNIETFRKEMFEGLELLEQFDTINSSNRIKMLFVRLLIQKDFDDFIDIQRDNIGRVKSIIFKDIDGGSIHANSGSTNSTDPNELDLEKHSVYFDTKDSIYEAEALFQVLIIWRVPTEDGTKRVKVRYTAHDKYLITHFLKEDVTKEVYDYVFPRLRTYKKLKV